MLELVLNLAVKQYALTIFPLIIAKPSVRCFLPFSEEAVIKLSFLQFLEMLLLPLVGILFTMQGVRCLHSTFSSSLLAYLLMTDNPQINHPFHSSSPTFITRDSNSLSPSHIFYMLGHLLFSKSLICKTFASQQSHTPLHALVLSFVPKIWDTADLKPSLFIWHMAIFLIYLDYFLVHLQDSVSFSKNSIGWFSVLLPDRITEFPEAIMTFCVSADN